MTQARSGAVRAAVGQLIWSSHAAPATRTRAHWPGALAPVSPTAGHTVQPPPRGPGRNGRPPAPRCWRRPRPGPGAGQAKQARCGSLAYLPAHRQPGRPAQPARPAPGKPAQRTTAHRQHRTHPPDPAPQATRPGLGTRRDPPGSTGSADERSYQSRESASIARPRSARGF
jgi:hypothetical protein